MDRSSPIFEKVNRSPPMFSTNVNLCLRANGNRQLAAYSLITSQVPHFSHPQKRYENLNGNNCVLVVSLPIFALSIFYLFFLLNAARSSAELKR